MEGMAFFVSRRVSVSRIERVYCLAGNLFIMIAESNS